MKSHESWFCRSELGSNRSMKPYSNRETCFLSGCRVNRRRCYAIALILRYLYWFELLLFCLYFFSRIEWMHGSNGFFQLKPEIVSVVCVCVSSNNKLNIHDMPFLLCAISIFRMQFLFGHTEMMTALEHFKISIWAIVVCHRIEKACWVVVCAVYWIDLEIGNRITM